jgi:acetolactate synthase-1/2/3 large subunit
MTEPLTTAESLLAAMKQAGIDYLLANAGTDFPPIIEAYARAPETGLVLPEPVVVHHEGVAVAMAHGFHLATGGMVAVMVHVNVGLANTTMGLINAAADNVPILMCSGRTPLTEGPRFGRRSVPIHWGQEMRDQAGLVREMVKWDYELRYPEQAADLVARAMAIAGSAPRGPVYLSLPREVLAEPLPEGARGADATRAMPSSAMQPDPQAVERAADLLAAATRPLIIAQRPAARDSFEPLSDFAERFAIPVVEFWATRNALAGDHRLHGGNDPAPWLADADLVITLDAMVPWLPDKAGIDRPMPVVALGADPLFARVPVRGFPVDVSLAGDPAAALRLLGEAAEARCGDLSDRRTEMARRCAALRAEVEPRVAKGGAEPMGAAWVSRCLSHAKAEDAMVFNELGIEPAAMTFRRPGTLFNAPLSGGLGWGMPAALGAKLADRSRQVIACVGDGSYLFANPAACHQVAAVNDLAILTIVFNNGVWNAVRRATTAMYPRGRAVELNTMPFTALGASPDYCAIAGAHGAHAEKVTDGADLPAALERALAATAAGRQALLDVAVGY